MYDAPEQSERMMKHVAAGGLITQEVQQRLNKSNKLLQTFMEMQMEAVNRELSEHFQV
jgi:hypothetical protein